MSTSPRHNRTVTVPLLRPETTADAGRLGKSTSSESLSLSVTDSSAGSVLLAGGISNIISEALRLLAAAGRSMSLSGSGTILSLVAGGVVNQVYQ
jgi:hypothetical protein